MSLQQTKVETLPTRHATQRDQTEPTWITWRCPNCNWKNQDAHEETAVPMCGGCGKDVYWDEIETNATTH